MHKSSLVAFILIITLFLASCRKSLPSGGGPPGKPEIPKIIETDPAVIKAKVYDISTNVKGFYEALPARYNETDYKYPTLIFCHGGGQFGDGVTYPDTVLTDALPKLLAQQKFPPSFKVGDENFSFIIIMPQFKKMPAPIDVDRLVEHVKAQYRVDTSRLYVIGFSLGGRMADDYAAFRPKTVAAVVSMGGLSPISESLQGKVESLVNNNVPLWHFHNKDDRAWPYSEAVEYISRINNLNPNPAPLFTSFDKGTGKGNHDCWNKVCDPAFKVDDKNIYEWMLGYKR